MNLRAEALIVVIDHLFLVRSSLLNVCSVIDRRSVSDIVFV
jgi:hypothetical protein